MTSESDKALASPVAQLDAYLERWLARRRLPDNLRDAILYVFEAGGKRNVILMPSSRPHQRPSDLCLANCERYIEAGLEHGAM